jgi:DNA-binding NarL/FixJ family response regulator
MSQPALARSSVRILIVEDHTLFAESLELALSMEGYDVRRLPVQENHMSQGALLSAVVRLHPRIVLLDLDLGHLGDGVRLIAPIARSGAHVVVVTASPERGRWGECLRYGARKVLSKARPLNEIMATVRRLNQGLPVMDREEREELLQAWHRERQQHQELRARLQRLTTREREVLGHLTEGHTVRDIARLSVVSEATVRTQVKSILAKLEVSSQLAAVGLAHAVGWRPPGP